jgi:hypothetical protein
MTKIISGLYTLLAISNPAGPRRYTTDASALENRAKSRLSVFGIFSLSYAIAKDLSTLFLNAETMSKLSLLAESIVETILVAVSAVFLFLAFRNLSRLDSRRFRAPMSLMVLLITGILLSFIFSIPQILSSLPLVHSEAYSLLLDSIALWVLAGFIGGALGLWRIGTRYSVPLIKAAAICFLLSWDNLIPIINILSAVLILWGLTRLSAVSSQEQSRTQENAAPSGAPAETAAESPSKPYDSSPGSV